MNSRERFLATMRFEKVDRPLCWENAFWVGTIRRWYKEGLLGINRIPKDADDNGSIWGPGAAWTPEKWGIIDGLLEYFQFDKGFELVPIHSWIWPPFEFKVIEEKDGVVTRISEAGEVQQILRGSPTRTLHGPVRNRKDWERLREERFNPDFRLRLSENWQEYCQRARNRDYPIVLGGIPCGFYASVRELFGPEQLLVAYFDQPDLLHEILDYLLEFWIQLWEPVLREVEVDCLSLFEDMCYKNGSIISPNIFREFMLPRYQRLTGFVRSYGVDIVILDTDGDCNELVPLFLEGGISGLFPMEVQAGMNIVKLRKSFPSLQMMGGLDKQKIARGKAATREEVLTKVPFMIKTGGYVPSVDHAVPPYISLADFTYYRKLLRDMCKNWS